MWPFWLWLVKSTGNKRSKLKVTQNSVFDTLQIRESLYGRHQVQGIDRGALGSPRPEEGGRGVM